MPESTLLNSECIFAFDDGEIVSLATNDYSSSLGFPRGSRGVIWAFYPLETPHYEVHFFSPDEAEATFTFIVTEDEIEHTGQFADMEIWLRGGPLTALKTP